MSSVASIPAMSASFQSGSAAFVGFTGSVSASQGMGKNSDAMASKGATSSQPTVFNVHKVEQSSAPSPAQSVPKTQTTQTFQPVGAQTAIPLGVLLSVSRPPSSESMASTDYQAMELALRADNIAGAQQAYQRLQNDLVLAQTSDAGTSSASAPNSALNAIA
jgi:hypothetical protein